MDKAPTVNLQSAALALHAFLVRGLRSRTSRHRPRSITVPLCRRVTSGLVLRRTGADEGCWHRGAAGECQAKFGQDVCDLLLQCLCALRTSRDRICCPVGSEQSPLQSVQSWAKVQLTL